MVGEKKSLILFGPGSLSDCVKVCISTSFQISEQFFRIGFFTVSCSPYVSYLYDYFMLISNVKRLATFSVAGADTTVVNHKYIGNYVFLWVNYIFKRKIVMFSLVLADIFM